MANTKAAKKDILINKRNHKRNQAYKTQMKTLIKKAQTAINEKEQACAEIVKKTLRYLDKCASKGVIKKQASARKKSKLSLAYNKISASIKPAKSSEKIEKAEQNQP